MLLNDDVKRILLPFGTIFYNRIFNPRVVVWHVHKNGMFCAFVAEVAVESFKKK